MANRTPEQMLDVFERAEEAGFYFREGLLFRHDKPVSMTKVKHKKGFRRNPAFHFRIEGRQVQAPTHLYAAYMKYGEEMYDKYAKVTFVDGNTFNLKEENILLEYDIPEHVLNAAQSMAKRVKEFKDKLKEEKYNYVDAIDKFRQDLEVSTVAVYDAMRER